MGIEYKKEYMDIAVKMAHEVIDGGCGGPFGCVIVQGDRIVARAHNTVVRDNDPTAHGEVNAIRLAGKTLGKFDLSDCVLYTTSEPCPMCLASIMWARIPVVYSAMNINDAREIGFDDKPFYDAINEKVMGKSNEFVREEFHREESAVELFKKYSSMEKTSY